MGDGTGGLDSQFVECLSKKDASPPRRIQEHDEARGPREGECQSRHSTTGSQIENRTGGLSSGTIPCLDERRGVVQMALDVTRPEEPERSRTIEDREEAVGHSRYAGLITTKRWGSSPSERVETPSISVAASWTTLRSAGDIGSR